jgi:hypothetical protein
VVRRGTAWAAALLAFITVVAMSTSAVASVADPPDGIDFSATTSAVALVATERVRLDAATAAATEALEQASRAQEADEAAQRALTAAQSDLADANATLARARERLGGWAREAYRVGSPVLTDDSVLSLLTAGGPGEVVDGMVTLGKVGHSKSLEIEAFEAASRRRDEAARVAEGKAVAAEASATSASTAHESARAAVRSQQQRLETAQRVLDEQVAAAASAGIDATYLNDMISALTADPDLLSRIGRTGACLGSSVAGYGNGRIPPSALCPVFGAPGKRLRADAAYAFERMSTAYAERFGTPICVTDAYRDLAGQQRVYATKPHLAAVPGTSNHGWARALDLCGGVQSFGTPQHAWLKVSSTLYGWYHPGWAEPGGSRPEPWHWEYGG